MEQIKFAVIQSGHAVFGVGSTKNAALIDAAKWLEDENHVQGGLTPEQVEGMCRARPNDGDLAIISNDHPEFDDYMRNQGAYVNLDGKWFNE